MKHPYDYTPEPVYSYWSVEEYDGGSMEWHEQQAFLTKETAIEYTKDLIRYRYGEDSIYANLDNYRFIQKDDDYIAIEFRKPDEKFEKHAYKRTDMCIVKKDFMVVK